MVISADVDDETKELLIKFLVEYDNEAYFTDVIKKENARFIECSIADYETVIQLNKILNEE